MWDMMIFLYILHSCSLFKFSSNQGVETGAVELLSEESKSDTSHLGFPHCKILQGIYMLTT